MSAYFIDCDGVFFRYGTMEPIPGAIETVTSLAAMGHQIYFVTKRTHHNDPPRLSITQTKRVLRRLSVPYHGILEGVQNPRILINDDGAVAITSKRDEASMPQLSDPTYFAVIAKKTQHALSAIAHVANAYPAFDDADDYVQTLIVARSLIANGTIIPRDIIRRYRQDPGYRIRGMRLDKAGLSRRYHGQLHRLIRSNNPEYQAKHGVSDGAAMKILPLVARFAANKTILIREVDTLSRITHPSPEARAAAILIALRGRQLLLSLPSKNQYEDLLSEFRSALTYVGIPYNNLLTYTLSVKSAQACGRIRSSDALFRYFAKHVGFEHLAWSTPVSACFYSFRTSTETLRRFVVDTDRALRYKNYAARASSLLPDIRNMYIRHLNQTGEYRTYMRGHGHHWTVSLDTDTFLSICGSLVAMNDPPPEEPNAFGDDLATISARLSCQTRPHSTPFLSEWTARFYRLGIREIMRDAFAPIRLHLGIKRLLGIT